MFILYQIGGPDFFIALAAHTEWGQGNTVLAQIEEGAQGMDVVAAIMQRPLVMKNWGSINATELVTPLPFTLFAS